MTSEVDTCKRSPSEPTTVALVDTESEIIEKNVKSTSGSITIALVDAQSKIIKEKIP